MPTGHRTRFQREITTPIEVRAESDVAVLSVMQAYFGEGKSIDVIAQELSWKPAAVAIVIDLILESDEEPGAGPFSLWKRWSMADEREAAAYCTKN